MGLGRCSLIGSELSGENAIPMGSNRKSRLHAEVTIELAGPLGQATQALSWQAKGINQSQAFKQQSHLKEVYSRKQFPPIPPSEAQLSRRKTTLPFSQLDTEDATVCFSIVPEAFQSVGPEGAQSEHGGVCCLFSSLAFKMM